MFATSTFRTLMDRGVTESNFLSSLTKTYNIRETFYRLRALFYMLDCIIDHKVDDLYLTPRKSLCERSLIFYHLLRQLHRLLHLCKPQGSQNIVVKPDVRRYSKTLKDYNARACPYSTTCEPTLPLSTLPSTDNTTTRKVFHYLLHGERRSRIWNSELVRS